MKQTICDNCNKKISGEKFLEIKSSSDTELCIKNNLDNRKLISLYNYSEIHFCSKDCLINYFFDHDQAIPVFPKDYILVGTQTEQKNTSGTL